MYCKNCGNKLGENDKFCPNCGGVVDNTSSDVKPVEVKKEVANTVTPQPIAKSNNKIILIIIGCVLAAGALVAAGFLFFNNNNKNKADKKESNINEYEDKDDDVVVPDIIDDDNDIDTDVDTDDTTNVDNSSSITFKNFKFNKVSGYEYKETTNGLQITSSSDVIIIELLAGSFDTLKAGSSKLEESFKAQGYDASNIQIKEYGSHEYITAEVSKNGIKTIILYGKANSSYIYVIGVANRFNTADYSTIYKVNKIIDNATYVG